MVPPESVRLRALVTGSSGHLGEALVRTLRAAEIEVVSMDLRDGPFTSHAASVVDRRAVASSMTGVDVVYHAATLHKPHVATHRRQDFVDTNVTGTLNLLEEASAHRVSAFVFTSTTSTFGDALVPPPGEPAAWITEDVAPRPKNIYGVTKVSAENLCQLFSRNHRLPCVVLRTSRFFPEEDDDRRMHTAYEPANTKVNELLYRRADIEDIVIAHLAAARRAADLGFGRYIISATTPFTPADLPALRADAPAVVRRRAPAYEAEYRRRGWKMIPSIDRVYVNHRARRDLGWAPRHDFAAALERLARDEDHRSALARAVGAKPYHAEAFEDGPYPVE
jgi:nucleoside-diphosphate-sugar epimerase